MLHSCGMNLPSIPIYIKSLGAVAVVLTAILVFVKEARKFVADSYAWVWRRLAPKGSPYRVDLRITPRQMGYCHWNEGSCSGKPCMQVRCYLFVSNVGPCPDFQILEISIRKPKTQGFIMPLAQRGMLPPWRPPIRDTARLASTFSVMFMVEPPVVKSGQTFIADIVLVDQFGEKHIAKKVEFKPIGGREWANLEARLKAQKQPPKQD